MDMEVEVTETFCPANRSAAFQFQFILFLSGHESRILAHSFLTPQG